MPQQMSRSDHSLPNGGNPEELLKLMLQTVSRQGHNKFLMLQISGGMPLEEGMSQLTPDSMTGSQMAISPQMIHPPVSQPQIIVHENNNEILKVLAMQVSQRQLQLRYQSGRFSKTRTCHLPSSPTRPS